MKISLRDQVNKGTISITLNLERSIRNEIEFLKMFYYVVYIEIVLKIKYCYDWTLDCYLRGVRMSWTKK